MYVYVANILHATNPISPSRLYLETTLVKLNGNSCQFRPFFIVFRPSLQVMKLTYNIVR